MRMQAVVAALGVMGITAALSLPTSAPASPDKFVVHEWGTFTSMQGAPGEILEGLQHESEPLPGFVHSRTGTEPSPFARFGDHTRNTRHVRRCTGKMETPVIYFYGGRERHVNVHVDFTAGLLTQWFPHETKMAPALDASATDIDLGHLAASSLDWDLDLVPFEAGAPASMPKVERDAPWDLARQVRANYVVSGNEADHYVFYRGLGRMDVPLSVNADEHAALVTNDTVDAIPASFVVEMNERTGRFVEAGPIAAGGFAQAKLDAEPLMPKALVISRLEKQMQAALVAQGLFEDEATAMVRTWSSTWFGQSGRRVLYLVPRAQTDAVIPLRITPAPDTLVRVLVGRLEFLTPGEIGDVEKALIDRDAADAPTRDAASARLAKLGRFLEPAARAVLSQSTNPAARESAMEVVTSFSGATR